MIDFDEIIRGFSGSIVSIDGRAVMTIYKDYDGKYHAYRMPRCSIGDYFAVLSWLMDEDVGPVE